MKQEMTVFLTVFLDSLDSMWRGYWLVTPFNNIARYCERMLGYQHIAVDLTTAKLAKPAKPVI
jgi:hypothetical protein